MPPLSVLIKPASSSCNLRCRYCFYNDIAEKREIKNNGLMSEQTLECVVKRVLSEATDVCTFAFQGGEPTLVGLDFYKRLIVLEQKYNVNHCKIHNAIQTNGIVIDEEWASFLAAQNFLVGISLDGPPEIHNLNRIDAKEEGTYNKVIKTIRLFDKYQVEYNILYVVTSATAKHPEKIYRYFKKQGFQYLQFIPCLDPYGNERGQCAFSLTPELYAGFLKKTFDLWYADIKKGDIVSIRFFDNLVGMVAGFRPEACGMSGTCQCQFVIEADGSVYPCDFYAFDKYKIGNIFNDSFKKMFHSEQARQFIIESQAMCSDCQKCRWYPLCRGGCRRDRDYQESSILGKNYFCSALQSFFVYSAAKLGELTMLIRPY